MLACIRLYTAFEGGGHPPGPSPGRAPGPDAHAVQVKMLLKCDFIPTRNKTQVILSEQMPGASLMINHQLRMFTLTWDAFNVSENSNDTLQYQVNCSIETESDLSTAVSFSINSTSLTGNLSSGLEAGASFNCCVVVAAGGENETWIVCTESVISTGNLINKNVMQSCYYMLLLWLP